MTSVYNKTDNETIITRINNLKADSKGLWGKMTVDQMLKHVNETVIVPFGENSIKVNFILKLLGKMMKKKVFESGFGENSPTAKELIFNEHYNFEDAKAELIKNFNRFTEGHQSIKIKAHPFWGKMSYEDWDKLMWMHTDHHLKQFGV